MIVRRATGADVNAMRALGDELQLEHVRRWPQIFAGDRDTRPHWASYIDKVDHLALLACRGDAVLGMVLARLIDETAAVLQPIRICRIDSIVVTSAERGSGVGRKLVAAVEAWGREHGAKDLRLSVYTFNESAIAAYERMGLSIRAHTMGKLL